MASMGLGWGDTKQCKGSLENFLALEQRLGMGTSFL